MLRGIVLSGAEYDGTVLSGTALRGTVLSGTVLSGTVLSGIVLSGTVLGAMPYRDGSAVGGGASGVALPNDELCPTGAL